MDSLLYFVKQFIPVPVFRFFQPGYHYTLSFIGALYYGFPSRRLTVIGVTGTNGKSTVVEMLHSIFSAAGHHTASLSSIRFKIGDRVVKNRLKMTMPGRFFVQQFLHEARLAGCSHVILEVTSEGIAQFRHAFIEFSAAGITNLTPEHIESHGSFENYRRAKGRLFASLRGRGISVANLSDESAQYFLSFPAARKIGYALESNDAGRWKDVEIIAPSRYEIADGRITLYFAEGWTASAILEGKFNGENILLAIAIASAFGVSHETMREAFMNFRGVPGRMEEIAHAPFRVVVDYAFTPNALRKVYATLAGSPAHSSRLICILGAAGGGRDKWKRPELGRIAGEMCNHVIITNEDPYDEDPRAIMREVESGAAMGKASCAVIEDRQLAIREALKMARPGDTVVITGKGCEDTIAVAGNKRIPWDDRMVVRDELNQLTQEKI